MSRLLYVIYLCIIAAPIFIVLTILTALVTIIGCLLGGERIFSYYPGMLWSKAACYLVLCPVKVRGREHINRKQTYIFVSNHQSAFDIFLIYGFLGTPFKWMMKIGLAKLPFVGAACRAAGFIFVDNSTKKAAAKSVREAKEAVKNGSSLVVFPEGSRSPDGKMARFKKGAFQIAVDQQMQVVPVTLNGPYDVMPIHTYNIHRQRLEMVIHPPLPTEGVENSHKGLQDLADRAQAVIREDLWEKYR